MNTLGPEMFTLKANEIYKTSSFCYSVASTCPCRVSGVVFIILKFFTIASFI